MRPLSKNYRLDADEISKMLPQRPPLLLVDRVLGFRADPEAALLCSFTLSPDHPIFAAHFPGQPIWPGAYTVEGLAQASQLLLILRGRALGLGMEGTGLLSEVELRLLRPVLPGAELHYRVDLIGEFAGGFRLLVEARVGRIQVAEGRLAVALR